MWKITAQADDEAEILLYDIIGDYSPDYWTYNSAANLIKRIKELGNVKKFTLRINSIGGDVFEAHAMYSYLRTYPADVIVRIDGLAASAASIVAMAGNKIIMPSNALMMIHNPAGYSMGDADDFRAQAELLDKVRDIAADIYSARTGLEREKIIDMMNSETWMSAKEALTLKFCDEIEEPLKITAMAAKNGGVFMETGRGKSFVTPEICAKLPKNFKPVENKYLPENTKDDSKMNINNIADLEREFPEFVNEIRNNAIKSERERLQTLDSLNAPGGEEIIMKAKYEEPKDARDIAIEILQAANSQKKLNNMYNDAQIVNSVLEPQRTQNKNDDEQFAINAVANELNRMRGFK